MSTSPSGHDLHAPPQQDLVARRATPGQVLRHDVPASLVVFLVAVPLSLGIAAASGAPLSAGLVSAAVGGIVAGLLGGSQLQVSGPAAGMVVLVAGLLASHGPAAVAAVVLAAGLIQVVLGLIGAGRFAMAIPPAVVHGMLAGIGISIVLSQGMVMLGATAHSEPLENLRALPGALVHGSLPSIGIGLLTIAVLVAWPHLPEKVRVVPAALVAILVATLTSRLLHLDVKRPQLPDNLLDLSFVPRLGGIELTAFLGAALSMALLASIESLLSAVAVDRLHNGPRVDLRRELVGQGAANMACGALGGLPVTGVIVRSSTNAMAGGRTRAAAVLHGVWVLLASVLLAGLIESIPLAALAGLLVHVGAKLVNIAHVRELAAHRDLWAYLVTIAGVLLVGLVEGVVVGILVAFWLLRRRQTWHQVQTTVADGRTTVEVHGAVGFVTVPELVKALDQVPHGSHVHLVLDVDYLDHAAITVLTDWIDGHRNGGGTVEFDEAGEPWLSEASEGRPMVTRDSRPGRSLLERLPSRRGHSPVLAGVDRSNRRREELLPTMVPLAEQQAPTTLFITCCDSRVVPSLITSSGPGDLFVLRTIGNMVPRPGHHQDASALAAIEYAVDVLGVQEVVLCGHTSCGAMKGLAHGVPAQLEGLGRWLEHADPALRVVAAQVRDGEVSLDELSRRNVLSQLEHLREMPVLKAHPEVRLIGTLFDIGAATTHVVAAEHPTNAASHLVVPAG